MTLGEKIKQERKANGLTQEELANKLMVSRQAVTKWESDKGMPDIENLKVISTLFGVSLDYLLSDEEQFEKAVIREQIDLSKYDKGLKKAKKDKIIREKYPQAKISTLLPRSKPTKHERIVDNLLGFLTDAPFYIPQFLNEIKNLGKEFYLAEQEDKQFFVIVSDEFIESREMAHKVINKKYEKFQIDNFVYINCGPIIEK